MSEIKYTIKQLYLSHDRYELSSTTSYLGDLSLSKKQFEAIGRPTIGDTLILSLRPLESTVKRDENESK